MSSLSSQLAEAQASATAAATAADDAAAALSDQMAVLKVAESALYSLLPAAAAGGEAASASATTISVAEVEAALERVRSTRQQVRDARRTSGVGKAPTPARVAAAAAREAVAAAGGIVSPEMDPPMLEKLADYVIEGAKGDSVVTNPAMAIAGFVDYVQEWRDALVPDDGEDAVLVKKGDAHRAAANGGGEGSSEQPVRAHGRRKGP